MNLLSNPLLIAGLILFFIVRQFMPQPVRARQLLAIPLVAAVLGVQSLARTPLDGALADVLFGVNLVLAAGTGLMRGASIRVFRDAAGSWTMRGTVVTLVLWVVSIGTRVALGGLSHGASSMGELEVLLAVTFGAQNVVVWARTQGGANLPALVR